MNRFHVAVCFLYLFLPAITLAQQSTSAVQPYIMQPRSQADQQPSVGSAQTGQQQAVEKSIISNAPSYPAPDPATLPPPDASVSVRQAAVECAIAQRVEQMGREYQMPGNIIDTLFKAGECSGKVQTFMLVAQTEYPNCFPKISLEEGISIFVNWAAAHNEAASENYVAGMTEAFAQTVPCLKK